VTEQRQATLARVAQVWVFPVKSMSGTEVRQAEVVAGGLAGDRSWAVVDDDTGETVTAAQEPRLRQAVPHLVGGELRLDVPGAPPGLDVDAAGEALSAWLGRRVRLAHRDGAGFVDVAPVHVVSTTSVSDAAHAEECDTCDITAPRANLVLDLDPAAGSEREWVGRSLVAGSAGLRVVRLPKHCLGVYADVTAAGTVRQGDEVTAV
jgi:uncharacterized protein YcbX